MNLEPTRGLVFLTPIDEIVPEKQDGHFGVKSQKVKPEEPYKFKVISVGGPLPFDGLFIPPEVAPGNIVSLHFNNQMTRERVAEGAGFLVNGVWTYGVDFRDILGIWK